MTLLAWLTMSLGCASHHDRTMNDHAQPLGRFAPLLGEFTGDIIPFNDAGERGEPIPIEWRCESTHWGRLLTIEFRIINDDPAAPIRGWTGLFAVSDESNECRTTWVSASALGAEGPVFGTRHIFAERGGFNADGQLVLRATQQDDDGEPIPYRSTYTFTERGMQVQDEVERDGAWAPTMLFDLRRVNE